MTPLRVVRHLRCTPSSSTTWLLVTPSTISSTRSSRRYQNETHNQANRRTFHASTCLSRTGQRPNRRNPSLTVARVTEAPSRTRREEEQKQLDGKNIARLDMGSMEVPIRPLDFWIKAPGYLFNGKLGRRYLFDVVKHRFLAIGQPALMRRELFGSLWPSRTQDRGVIGPWAILPRYTNPRARAIIATAKSHYRLMNKYVASGLEDGLENICQTGLEQGLSEKIRAQKPGVTMEWNLIDRNGNLTTDSSALKAKLMHIRSTATAYTEGQPPIGVQEAIVYISGEEVLTVRSENGRILHEQRKKTSDYLVLQRRIVDKKVEGWYVHGMKQPTTFEIWCEEQERMEETDKTKGTSRWWSGLTSYL